MSNDDLYDFDGTSSSYSSSYTNNNNYNNYTGSSKISDPTSYSSYSTDTSTNDDRRQRNASSPGSTSRSRSIPTITTNMDHIQIPSRSEEDFTPVAPPASPIPVHPLGFTDVVVPSMSIVSDWKVGQRNKSIETQTVDVRTTESNTQTSISRDVSIQTSDDHPNSQIDSKGSVFSGFDQWVPKDEALLDFLRWSCMAMEKQLKKNETSHAFDDYDINNQSDDLSLTCLHVLSPSTMRNVKTVQQVLDEEERVRKNGGGSSKTSSSSYGIDLQSTSMSWNSTGSVLAVAYGRNDESGWCNITSAGCCL